MKKEQNPDLSPEDEKKILDLMRKLSTVVDEVEDMFLHEDELNARLKALNTARNILEDRRPKILPQ